MLVIMGKQLDLELHLRAMELKWVQLIQSNQLLLG
uniref:Uncharacterized protein n=1 Tax=Picea glauca TaxID=3330 RepID=A0A101M2T3_PICGL|nr:hypothetical protein ABT39_MTgene3100 [Picea glauca]QHR87201.1 hypothetical protein Q903MT_gene1210 [Picea sitchensis]